MRLRLHPAALVEFDEAVDYLEEQREEGVLELRLRGGPDVGDVALHPGDGAGQDGHHPVLVPLALAHGQDATFGVDAVERQVAKLGAPDAGRVQNLQHRAVTKSGLGAHVGLVEHALRLGGVHHVLRQLPAEPGQVEVGGRVRRQVIFAHHPPKEPPHGHEPAVLRVAGQRRAIGLAEVVQVLLVALQDGPRDLLGLGDALGLGPLHEEAQVALVVLDGPRRILPDTEPLEVPANERAQAGRVVRVADGRPWLQLSSNGHRERARREPRDAWVRDVHDAMAS